jgi:uncharacterized protein YbaR (Trm112 family)
MIDPELLKILCCPETHQPVALAAAAALEKINARIQSGGAHNRGGQAVAEKIEGGLVRADGKFLYPIRQGIPIMLMDEALAL